MTAKIKLHLFISAAGLLSFSKVNAALITQFGFNAPGGGNNIDETTGWDGTSAGAGGFLDVNLTLAQTLQASGNFLGGSGNDVFHLDNWHSTASDRANQISLGNSVSFTIAADAGYEIDLGSGTGSFSTHLHDHFTGSNGNKLFDRIALFINGVDLGDQVYAHTTYGPTVPSVPQTLTWNFGTNPLLNDLSSADVEMYFWASDGAAADPTGDNAHGPQWDTADSAMIQLNGDVTPVPEPATTVFGLGVMGIALLRRRRK